MWPSVDTGTGTRLPTGPHSGSPGFLRCPLSRRKPVWMHTAPSPHVSSVLWPVTLSPSFLILVTWAIWGAQLRRLVNCPSVRVCSRLSSGLDQGYGVSENTTEAKCPSRHTLHDLHKGLCSLLSHSGETTILHIFCGRWIYHPKVRSVSVYL